LVDGAALFERPILSGHEDGSIGLEGLLESDIVGVSIEFAYIEGVTCGVT
jgi:hypothetical protein